MTKTYRFPLSQYPSLIMFSNRNGEIVVYADVFDRARKMCREELIDMRYESTNAHKYERAAYALADHIGFYEGYAQPSAVYQAKLDAERERVEKMLARPSNVHDHPEFLS